MHTVCLHGDIKPANLMVSRDGRIMPIDLGQAVLTNNISEADYESFENLKEDEKKKAKLVLAIFLRKAHEEGLQQAA
jgi:RIO-like serine/threonine protein kinase